MKSLQARTLIFTLVHPVSTTAHPLIIVCEDTQSVLFQQSWEQSRWRRLSSEWTTELAFFRPLTPLFTRQHDSTNIIHVLRESFLSLPWCHLCSLRNCQNCKETHLLYSHFIIRYLPAMEQNYALQKGRVNGGLPHYYNGKSKSSRIF